MSKQLTALKIANELENRFYNIHPAQQAVSMLRSQQAEIEALKAHPVKELSGVEIIGMSGKYDFTYEVDIIDFARAILRKAQEK